MSVIAWDGRIIATDRMINTGEMAIVGTKMKVLPNGEVLAWCGSIPHCLALVDWYIRGAEENFYPDFQTDKNDWERLIVVAQEDGGNIIVDEYLQVLPPLRLENKFRAWGSGAEIAFGAMAAGANAIAAVMHTNNNCYTTGFGIDFYDFEKKQQGRYIEKVSYELQ